MARNRRCPRPINRLVMLRAKGLEGPRFQNIGPTCVKGQGNFYGIGGPGSGPRAASGIVIGAIGVELRFTHCVDILGLTGIDVQIAGGAWTQVTGETEMSDTVYRFVTPNIDPGDDVRWRYIGGSNSIVDCDNAEDIGDQEIAVNNPLVLVGNFVLLSVGGKEITLLSNDVAQTEGVQTSDA